MGKRVLSEWEQLKKAVKGKHAKRFSAALDTMDDDEFVVHFPKILEYVIPKLQRVENKTKAEEDNKITIVHVTGKLKEEDEEVEVQEKEEVNEWLEDSDIA